MYPPPPTGDVVTVELELRHGQDGVMRVRVAVANVRKCCYVAWLTLARSVALLTIAHP
jgi:hypothetical protein